MSGWSRPVAEDDEEFEWPSVVGTGSAAVAGPAEDDDDEPIACLYVPNTDTRSGWGMRMVYRSSAEKVKRLIGFGRR